MKGQGHCCSFKLPLKPVSEEVEAFKQIEEESTSWPLLSNVSAYSITSLLVLEFGSNEDTNIEFGAKISWAYVFPSQQDRNDTCEVS